MDFNDSIRFAAVCNSKGDVLWNSKRTNLKNIVSLEDTKKPYREQLELGKKDQRVQEELDEVCMSL